MTQQTEISIVGGGITGLTLAYRFAINGFKVFLYEQSSQLGGLLRPCQFSGVTIEQTYHHIFKTDTEIISLINELDLSHHLKWYSSRVAFQYNDKLYPFSTVLDLLKYCPLSLPDRIRLGYVSHRIVNDADWHKYESITIKEWFISNVGTDIYNKVWQPLLKQKFSDDADIITMAWLYARLHARIGARESPFKPERLGYLDNSFSTLITALTNKIKDRGGHIFLNTPVLSILTNNDQVIALKTPEDTFAATNIILTPAPEVSSNLLPLTSAFKNELLKIRYHGAITALLDLKKTLSPFYWINITDPASPFAAVIEHTNLVGIGNSAGHNFLYLGKYLPHHSPFWKLSDVEIIQAYRTTLLRLFPSFADNEIMSYNIARDYYAQPLIPIHYSDIKPPIVTPIKGLFLSNMSQIYPYDRGINYSAKLANTVYHTVVNGINSSAEITNNGV